MEKKRMVTRKRAMVVGGILLAVVFAGVETVGAWEHGRWFGGRSGCIGWFHHGMGKGKDMPEFVLRRIDEKAAALNLTDTQKGKYDELRAGIKAHISRAVEDHEVMRESFRAELAKESPDVAGLTEKLKMKIQDASTAMQKHLDLFTAFYESLDSNQKKQLLSEVQKKMAEHPRHEAR